MVGKMNLKDNNFIVRSISAILLVPLIIYIILDGAIIFHASIGLISALMLIEWHRMIKNLRNKFKWSIIALIYIFLFALSLVWIRHQEAGQSLLLWLFITTWLADTGAFISGRVIGGPKLARKISPQKTWAGFIGAMVFSGMGGIIFGKWFDVGNMYKFIVATVGLGILAQIGDLSESWVKRKAGIKNSGRIIPGHGGILDRVDSLMMSSVALALFLVFFKEYLFQ